MFHKSTPLPMLPYKPTNRLAHYQMDPRVIAHKRRPKRTSAVSIRKISHTIVENYIDHTFDWCIKEFGIGKKEIPYVIVEPKYNEDRDLGWYDPEENCIGITIQGHRTLNNIVVTCIHEWIHLIQFQHNSWYARWFNEGYNYSNHPMELEAHHLSTILMPYCFEYCYNIVPITP